MTQEFDRKTPEGADKYFAYCISNGDVAGAMGCYDPEAVYIGRDGQPVAGLANIEKSMQKLCSMSPTLSGTTHHATVVGNLLIWLDTWTLTGKGPDGTPLSMKGGSACLMRRGKDGTWRWLVNSPFAAPFFKNVI